MATSLGRPSGELREAALYTVAAVFDTLADKLQAALGDLSGRKRLDEETISKAMREVRLALLEADVNFTVVKEFVASVKERAVGEEVLKSLTPGQQVVKIVHEELTELMGSGGSDIAFAGRPPTVILLAGLQGSGKTTAAAKLALRLRKAGKQPALVAADLQRPAAIDQLEQLGKQIQIPVHRKDVRSGRRRALGHRPLPRAGPRRRDPGHRRAAARRRGAHGRARARARRGEADERPARARRDDRPGGCQRRAAAFQERIAFDGVVLTKLDGDARGGAALSVRAVTGKPVKFISVGEKLDQLEEFHPDRMASRILGMGDVLTLIEKAEAAVEEDEQAALEPRVLAGQFTFDDFLAAQKMLKRMGPIQGVLKLLPGVGNQLKDVDIDERARARRGDRALDDPQERRMPHLINGSRRQRIAKGSGASLDEVNQLMSARASRWRR